MICFSTAPLSRILMRAPPPSLSNSITRLGFEIHAGQLLVLAFSHGLVLRESPTLQRIRAELRGLGAALLCFGCDQVFAFHPDDALLLNGVSRSSPPALQR